jgi:hypothetical protein
MGQMSWLIRIEVHVTLAATDAQFRGNLCTGKLWSLGSVCDTLLSMSDLSDIPAERFPRHIAVIMESSGRATSK